MTHKPTCEELEQRVRELERDAIEHKKTENALRESEEKVKALLNAPTNSSLLIDMNGIILSLNQTAAQSLGKRIRIQAMGNIHPVQPVRLPIILIPI